MARVTAGCGLWALGACVAAIAAMAASPAGAQTPAPGAGVPLDLAVARAALVGNLRYDLALSIPAESTAPVTGAITIGFDLAEASRPLVVDFDAGADHVHAVEVNARPVEARTVNGHIVLPAAALARGPNRVRIGFTAGDASLNRGADLLYTLFVPARARLAVPVFDQPDLKGRWTLTLEHPAAWRSVANGAELSRATSGDRTTVRFAETAPLPTYLVAFAAGRFSVETADRGGRTFRFFHRETDAAKVARNLGAIFDLHERALAFMEDYTGIPYAFGKFDFVAIPAFQFGGMEHAGQILYNASGLLLDESATKNQLLGRASVIAHETAHMWFGDLVTMRWFDDVWMKEVFANFMAAKIVHPSFPEVNHDLRFLLAHYPAAYEVDRTPGANPIRQPLDNLQEAGSLYGAIIYQKAPVVMRHLEALVGAERFRDGLREYLSAHAFGNAAWPDLIDVLDRRTPADLRHWSRVWVEEPGRPTIKTVLDLRDGHISRLAFHQGDSRGRGIVWPQQLRVAIGTADGVDVLDAVFDGEVAEVPAAAGRAAPRFVLANGGGWAYGDIEPDAASLAALVSTLPSIADPLTRASAWVTLWDALVARRLGASAFLDLAVAALPREDDEQLASRILAYAAGAWWRFLDAGERAARAAPFERLLRDGLAAAATPSRKAAWFGTLRTTALTPATVSWLRRVWARDEQVPGLPLAEADSTALALELAVREVDGWRDVLAAELARIENPDRKARFEFVMPALSSDRAEREAWFRSLADPSRRRREPWVLEGLAYLHHPLRAAASLPLVAPALDLLWEVQRTGDIFFPRRWLDATLSGHTTRAAADIVRAFLGALPAGFPERLRLITLQSADELFRAAAARP